MDKIQNDYFLLNKDVGTIPEKVLLNLYKVSLRIRRIEERIEELYPEDEMKVSVHLSREQEVVGVEFCINFNLKRRFCAKATLN